MPVNINDRLYEDVQYVSMSDYIRRVNEIDDFQHKVTFTTRYLLAYGAEERDVSLAEAIHIAKMKIVEASAKIRNQEIMIPDEAVNPHLNDEEDAANRQFMIEPVNYLLNEANHLLMSEANNGNNEASQRRIGNYQVMSAVLLNGANSGLPAQVSKLDIEPNARDMDARLKALYGGARQFESACKAAKPGFFSRLFGSSKAYTNLEAAYEAFNNPNHVLYGDLNTMDKAATEYLKHCFPQWDPKIGGISKAAIERLSSPKKDRALLSYNILKATNEQREVEKYYNTIIETNIQKRADIEAQAGDEVLENNAQFQQQINNEVANEEDLNSSQAERDYHANFVDGPEPEDDGPEIE